MVAAFHTILLAPLQGLWDSNTSAMGQYSPKIGGSTHLWNIGDIRVSWWTILIPLVCDFCCSRYGHVENVTVCPPKEGAEVKKAPYAFATWHRCSLQRLPNLLVVRMLGSAWTLGDLENIEPLLGDITTIFITVYNIITISLLHIITINVIFLNMGWPTLISRGDGANETGPSPTFS